MNKAVLMLVICMSFACSLNTTHSIAFAYPDASTAKPTPSYAKWGALAVKKAKNKYPNTTVVDYKHVRRTELSSTQAQETFKLRMKNGNHEFGLYVYIVFDIASENLRSISFKETSR